MLSVNPEIIFLFFIGISPETKRITKLPFKGIILIVKLATLPSTVSFIFIVYFIKKMGLINANIFANIIPVFTAIIAYFVLKESFDLKKIIGIVVVICGLFISQIPQFKKGKS